MQLKWLFSQAISERSHRQSASHSNSRSVERKNINHFTCANRNHHKISHSVVVLQWFRFANSHQLIAECQFQPEQLSANRALTLFGDTELFQKNLISASVWGGQKIKSVRHRLGIRGMRGLCFLFRQFANILCGQQCGFAWLSIYLHNLFTIAALVVWYARPHKHCTNWIAKKNVICLMSWTVIMPIIKLAGQITARVTPKKHLRN